VNFRCTVIIFFILFLALLGKNYDNAFEFSKVIRHNISSRVLNFERPLLSVRV